MAIEHISDTARWVAYYRAMESERPDAIFRDPYARRLAGLKGEEIVDTMKRGRMMAWPMVVRTAVFDDIIMECVTNRGIDTVLNIAAGLDARPWRLNLPKELKWFDVDLPDILLYKSDVMAGEKPNCRYEAIAADMTTAETRHRVFSRVGAEGANVLVVTEGLLIYLTQQQVEELAQDLASEASFFLWLIDIASPRLLQLMQRWWGKSVEKGNAPFRFAPPEGTEFYRPLGWREAEYHDGMDEAKRLRREPPFMPIWRFIARLYPKRKREEMKRMSGFVLLERNDITQMWETGRARSPSGSKKTTT